MWKHLCFSLAITLFMQIPIIVAGRKGCGGTYTAARGILTTPNFPVTISENQSKNRVFEQTDQKQDNQTQDTLNKGTIADSVDGDIDVSLDKEKRSSGQTQHHQSQSKEPPDVQSFFQEVSMSDNQAENGILEQAKENHDAHTLGTQHKGNRTDSVNVLNISDSSDKESPFEVPIRCQWVIDASNIISSNTSIIVYLTQLFSFEGLTFTEYQLYGSDYKINPKLIHKVNETNVIRTRWVQTYQSYLVIELKMQSAESAHLRVLDKFLDIYGFNITYEITTGGVRAPSCTMMDCGFTGICFDYYTKFGCSCFEGYIGPNCSEGPKSFCYTNGTPTCKNGGTCLHVGVAAVKCHCSKLFTGNTCETPVEPASAKDCPNCPTNCTYDGKLENACKCLSGKNGNPGKPGLIATLHLGNLPTLEPTDLKYYIKTQLLRYLRANFSKIEDLEIISLVHYMSGADVTFQVYGPKKEEKKVKNVLNKWSDRGYVGNITVAEKDNSIKTPLSIQSVDINQPGIIRENDEFILSCVARGSPSMTFRWFKDGIFVNLTYARHKWIKLIKDPHVTDQYTALLAVERAQKYDEGKFTCQVEDFNIQQCMSKFVKVKRRPLVKIEPMSLTVKKGQDFTVKCVTLEDNGGIGGKYTYSWTKNKELLPVKTDSEKYETLYPAGTILQIFHVEKDVLYSCLVQDGTSSSEKNIQVYVLDREGVHTCPQEVNFNLIWPETAPNTDFVQECPKDYIGIVIRRCVLSDGRIPSWGMPDFSQCTNKVLNEVYDKFQQLKLGYSTITLVNLIKGFLNYVTSDQLDYLRPGEGARILSLLQEVQEFLGETKINYHTIQNISYTIFSVVNCICLSPDALIRPQEINLLQKILFEQLKILGFYLREQENFKSSNLSLITFDMTLFKENPSQALLYIPVSGKKLEVQSWVSTKLTITRKESNYSDLFVQVIYRNLSDFFPPKSFLRIRDGIEIQYQVFSQIATFSPILQNESRSNDAIVTIDFQHKLGTDMINSSNNEKWEIKCGYADFGTFAYTWDIYACMTDNIDDRATKCVCPKYGSYVLLLMLLQPEEQIIPKEPHKYILISSFFLCIILTLFTTICLGTSCFLNKRFCLIILKLQCSLSIFLCEVLFVVAILVEPPQQYLMVYLTFLEMFLLLGISSHLSKLLIIFTELIEIPKSMTSKYTVIGIISGVPLITIFGNHLAYKTMDINLKSWWMIENSLAFNIFFTVISIVTALFIFIYLSVLKKLKELIITQEKHEKAVKKRIALIRRAGCLFFVLLVFTISSVVYINNQNVMWSVYQFSAVNILLGLVLLTCYIIKSETGFQNIFKRKPQKDETFFSLDSTGPLHFMTKQDTNLENQIGPRRQDGQQLSMKSMDAIKISVSKTQSISNAFESCLQSSSNFCDVTIKENSTLRRDKNQPLLETYNSSPPTLRKLNSNNTFSQSPDILTAKPCVPLDLVASSICVSKPENEAANETLAKPEKKSTEHKTVRIMFPPQVIITPDEAISKILEIDTAIQTERTRPDGHDEIVTGIEKNKEISDEDSRIQHDSSYKDDNLDGVLDSISQDLDYLLNRNDDTDSVLGSSTLSRKVSKPPGASVINKIPEELIKDESAGPEGIMLRTNC